jgi:hypothetical protein
MLQVRESPKRRQPTCEHSVSHCKFHWARFITRWRAGYPIPVPKTMFMGVVGRKLGMFATSPTIHWKWKTWLRTIEFSDALVYVVVCDNLGDPLPHP